MPDNPQSLFAADVFTNHPEMYTDSFLLLIKAIMMFGKVTDFGVRTHLRASAPSRNQNPFIIPGFEELDRLVCMEFVSSLPPRFRNGFSDLESMYGGGGLDTDLYLVHLVPHAYVTIRLSRPIPLRSFKCNDYVAQPLRRFLGSPLSLNLPLFRSISCHSRATLYPRVVLI